MDPPINSSRQARVGYPATGSPHIKVFTMMTIIQVRATRQNNIPITDAMANGTVEKATIPSKEYKKSFQNDHLVSPATRLTFSYSSHFVLNPIQPKMPLEKRLYSAIVNTAFIAR